MSTVGGLNHAQKWIEIILKERLSQLEKYGYKHDDKKIDGIIAIEAAALLLKDVSLDEWKLLERHAQSRERQLVVAATLVLAELERLSRVEECGGQFSMHIS